MKKLIVVTLPIVVMGCAVSQTKTPQVPVKTQQSLMESGAQVVEGAPLSLIGDAGVTYVESEGKWINYLSADGRKVVKTSDGTVKELGWRENENGEFCQEMFRTGIEECNGDEVVFLKDNDGFYHIVVDAEVQPYKFNLVEGNIENL